MKKTLFILIIFFVISGFSQTKLDSILSLKEYIGYVKKHHPIVKQANLLVTEGEIKLLKARGSFDPKIEVDYRNKNFKNTEYYKTLNASFKLPTWYGLELKGTYENNNGSYLNPEYKTPKDGLYSAGVSVSLAKGLLINKRMATLKQAKLYTKISEAKQQLLVNNILYNAINTYFVWLKNHQELEIYKNYKENARVRLQNVIKSFKAGDKAGIDTLEASINYKNRRLDLEKAKISFIKSSLETSNYLWLDNNIPVELNTTIQPDNNTLSEIDKTLNTAVLTIDKKLVDNHPKIQSLQLKKQQLNIDKKLKTNNLLPKIDVHYNFLTSDYNNLNSLNTSNYKAGVSFSFPLFLRKERSDLKLAKLKLQNLDFDLSATKISIRNKINATQQQIYSYQTQYNITSDLVNDYKKLVKAEERKFSLGEGSLFLINYREAKLIATELKNINTEYYLLKSKATYVKQLGKLN